MTPSFRRPRCCGARMNRLYLRRQENHIRRWVPVGYYCTSCKKTIVK